ncbi:MAG: hypothetical protein ACRDOB_04020 [Streptosporangiaceae bacterium]
MDEQPDILSSGSERRISDEWRLSDRRRGSNPSQSSPDQSSLSQSNAGQSDPDQSSPSGPAPDGQSPSEQNAPGPGRPGPNPGGPGRSWPGPRRPGRRGWVAILVAGALLISLGVSLGLTRLGTPNEPAASTASKAARSAEAVTVRPAISATAIYALPGAAKNAFSIVVLAVRSSPDSAPRTWLFVSGRGIQPGQSYGLLEDTCDGQFVTSSDLADGTADQHGYLAIVARNLDISPTASDVWILVYRHDDGTPVGGVLGPLTGQGAKIFRSQPPC